MFRVSGASDQIKGIVCILVSNAIFGLTDALSKVLTGDYPPGQILFFRSVFVFVSILIMVQWRGGWREEVRNEEWRTADDGRWTTDELGANL